MKSCQIQIWEVTGTNAERLALPLPLQVRARFFETDTGAIYEWDGVAWRQVAVNGVALQIPMVVNSSGTPVLPSGANPIPIQLYDPQAQLFETLIDIALSLRVVTRQLREAFNTDEPETLRNDEQQGPAVNLS